MDRIREYEEEDKKDGYYEEGSYEVYDNPLEWREIKDITKDKGLCRATNNKFIRN